MVERQLIAVEGIVQGVGFRPFVYDAARALDLRGSVRNGPEGVLIDVEGERAALDDFIDRLLAAPPPLARVARITTEPVPPRSYARFEIAPSRDAASSRPVVAPDAATCDACVAELFDATNRRYRYPFLSCAHCGPRLTIVAAVPYDRTWTTMAPFSLCAACRREYEDPRDRRFHAQTVACAVCGPRLRLLHAESPLTGESALAAAVQALRDGLIVAVKGVGGYHLAVDATNATAVERLRVRKHRAAKPLAVIVRDAAAAHRLCDVDPVSAALLVSPTRPIVLLRRRAAVDCETDTAPDIAENVAPGSPVLGIMLPYAPLHHLLLADTGRPLVMTSGNTTDEPIVYRDDVVLETLGDIADLVLAHDRAIETRCDDSVVRVAAGAPLLLRRSRGYAPRPLALPAPLAAPVVGVGGQLKNTFCLAWGTDAVVSHHVGDLDSLQARTALESGIHHYCRLFGCEPAVVAYDLHPDYASSIIAEQLAGVRHVRVQHHHAHVLACMAEHALTEPVIGVAFDGAGLGTDGAVWGGEFMLVERSGFARLAHLAYVPLPGGDAGARKPWRMAASHLWAACDGKPEHARLIAQAPAHEWAIVRQLLCGGRAPLTSSVGRLFDAVAALAGVRSVSRFEGEAAMALEQIADPCARGYHLDVRDHGDGWLLDPASLIRTIARDAERGRPAAAIAGAFHAALADAVAHTADRIRRRTGIRRVALTGGVFQNALLLEATADRLVARGLDVLVHRAVPCNDGGLSLGQVYAVALAGVA